MTIENCLFEGNGLLSEGSSLISASYESHLVIKLVYFIFNKADSFFVLSQKVTVSMESCYIQENNIYIEYLGPAFLNFHKSSIGAAIHGIQARINVIINITNSIFLVYGHYEISIDENSHLLIANSKYLNKGKEDSTAHIADGQHGTTTFRIDRSHMEMIDSTVHAQSPKFELLHANYGQIYIANCYISRNSHILKATASIITIRNSTINGIPDFKVKMIVQHDALIKLEDESNLNITNTIIYGIKPVYVQAFLSAHTLSSVTMKRCVYLTLICAETGFDGSVTL